MNTIFDSLFITHFNNRAGLYGIEDGQAQPLYFLPPDESIVPIYASTDRDSYFQVSLSADGHYIAVVEGDNPNGGPVLKLLDPGIAQRTLLNLSEDGIVLSQPVWHPNNQDLAILQNLPASAGNAIPNESVSIVRVVTPLAEASLVEFESIYSGNIQQLLGFSADATQLYLIRSSDDPVADLIYSRLNLQDGSIQAMNIDSKVGDKIYLVSNFQFIVTDAGRYFVFNLVEELYSLEDRPGYLRIIDAGTEQVIATVQTDSLVQSFKFNPDLTKVAYLLHVHDQATGLTTFKLQIASVPGNNPPQNLSLEGYAFPFDIVGWLKSSEGLLVSPNPAKLDLITLDGKVHNLVDQTDTGLESLDIASAGIDFVLQVPFVHQVHNTEDNFNGTSACGPTSCVMAAAAYGKLAPRNDVYGGNVTEYGYYVTHYTDSEQQSGLIEMQNDPKGRGPFGGAWGTSVQSDGDGGYLAYAWRMEKYLDKHNLNAIFVQNPTSTQVKQLLRENKPVVISTKLTPAGHLIVAKGLTRDGLFICNDPYLDYTNPNRNWRNRGDGEIYSWEQLKVSYIVMIADPLPSSTEPNPRNKKITEPVRNKLVQLKKIAITDEQVFNPQETVLEPRTFTWAANSNESDGVILISFQKKDASGQISWQVRTFKES